MLAPPTWLGPPRTSSCVPVCTCPAQGSWVPITAAEAEAPDADLAAPTDGARDPHSHGTTQQQG